MTNAGKHSRSAKAHASPRPGPAKGVFLARVQANAPVCRDHWCLVLELDDFPPAQPGQFVQILCTDPADDARGDGPLLRRPFSIGGLRRPASHVEIDILHRIVGRGTHWLSQLEPGQSVSILGPLGQPFRLFEDRPRAFLVGGGVGLPPLIWLAEALHDAGTQTIAFCGAKSAELLPLTPISGATIRADEPGTTLSELARFNVPAVVSTDDGSLGTAGTVSDAFARYLDRHRDQAGSAVAYTCGPEPMMRAVAAACAEHAIDCQVCLERMMACGMGTCQSCVVRVRDDEDADGWRYRLCCTDGPVFDSRLILWDE